MEDANQVSIEQSLRNTQQVDDVVATTPWMTRRKIYFNYVWRREQRHVVVDDVTSSGSVPDDTHG